MLVQRNLSTNWNFNSIKTHLGFAIRIFEKSSLKRFRRLENLINYRLP